MSVTPSNLPSNNIPRKRTYGKSSYKHTFLENNFDTLMSQFNKGNKVDTLGNPSSIPNTNKKPCKSTSHIVSTHAQSKSRDTTHSGHLAPLNSQKKSVSLPTMTSANPFDLGPSDNPPTTKIVLSRPSRPTASLLKAQSSSADLFGFPESGSDSDGMPVPVSEHISLFRKKRNRIDRHSLATHIEADPDPPPLPRYKSPRREKSKPSVKQLKPRPRPLDSSKSPCKRTPEPTEIHDVKQPHQCRELGQQQMFRDEVQYLLDCIKQSQPLSTRCLALCSLATDCLSPRFRRQLSFHQLIPQLASSLSDTPGAPPPLRLAAASVLYALSRDRSSTELGSDTLRVLIQLTSDYTQCEPTHPQRTQSSEEAVREFELNRAMKTTSPRVSDLLASLEHTETHPLPPKGPISHQLLAAMAMQSLISLQKEDFSSQLSEIGGVEAVSSLINSSLQAVEGDLEASTNGRTENKMHRSRFNKFKTGDNTYSFESKSQMNTFLLSNSLLSLNSITKKHHPSLQHLASTAPQLPHVLFRCVCANRRYLERDPSCQVAYECLKQAMTSITELCNEVDEFSQLIIQSAEYLTSLVECVLTLAPTFVKESQFDIQIIGLMALVNHLAKSDTSCEGFLQLVSWNDEILFVQFVNLYFVKQREAELLTRELSLVISRIKQANSPSKKQLNLSIQSETDSNDSFNSSFSPHMSNLSVRESSSHALNISLPIEYYNTKLIHKHSVGSTQVLEILDTPHNMETTDLSMSVKEMADFIREAATSEEVKGKATDNFESSILAAMVSLLVGLVASKNSRAQSLLSQRLRLEDFEKMATLLHQMLSFYNLVCDSPVAREKTTQLATEVLRFFTSYL